ncbi:hexose kinase [Actinomycetaceae bacterium L2_0104]
MTIHALTPHPALDVTYTLASPVVVHGVNRVAQVTSRPGGKGVNVARLAADVGEEVAVYGFIGGRTGEQVRENLRELAPAIDQRWTDVEAETRRTVAVVDGVDTTMFNEPGANEAESSWRRLGESLLRSVRRGDVVTISGSLPHAEEPGYLSRLVRELREQGAVVVADTSGPALLAAAEAGADLVKPNRDELMGALGCADIGEGAAALLERGVGAVLVSLGAEGMRLETREDSCVAKLSVPVAGNPTGAGDAVVAALAVALANAPAQEQRSRVLLSALNRAVAWSAAAVLSPVAGEIDREVAAQLHSGVHIAKEDV